jgi:hypothetical protein
LRVARFIAYASRMADEPATIEQDPQANIVRDGGDHAPLSLDDIFHPPDPEAEGATKESKDSSSDAAEDTGKEGEGKDSQGDAARDDKGKFKSKSAPDSDGLVTVKDSRGNEFRVSKDVAALFENTQQDYKALQQEFTRRNQQPREGAADDPKAQAERVAEVKAEYNERFIDAIDHPDKQSLVDVQLDLMDDYVGPLVERRIKEAVEKLVAQEIQPWREALSSTTDLLEGQVRKQLPLDLEDLGYAEDAADPKDVTQEYRSLRQSMPKEATDREVFLRAISRVANRSKKPDTSNPRKVNGTPNPARTTTLRGGGADLTARSSLAGKPIHRSGVDVNSY